MSSGADTRLRRIPERGSKDFATACAIIDATIICHVGFSLDGQPYVVPMACAREGRNLLIHGSVASRLLKSLGGGLPCCVTVTHLDGVVLARSSFHSSMNYRSVMVFGTATQVTGAALGRALDVLVDHLTPGRRADIREPTRKEINATTLLSLPIEVFTTKVRTGPPDEPASDVSAPIWAGVVPLAVRAGTPIDAPDLPGDIAAPDYLQRIESDIFRGQ